jgi:hypothetical protein
MEQIRHSTRGIGVRFLLALILPIAGIALNIWTVAQLCAYQFSRV